MGKGLRRLSPAAGKGLACSVVLASLSIREHEGPGHMPNTLLLGEQPSGHPTGHVHGMDGHCYRKHSFKQVGVTPLAGAALSSAQLSWGMVPRQEQEVVPGGDPCGRGGSPAPTARTGQGPQHRP